MINLYLQVERQHVQNIVVDRGVSSCFFGIPFLIYSWHSSQTIFDCETFFGKVEGWRTITLLKWNSSAGIFKNFLIASAEQLLCRKAFFKMLIFLENYLVASCYCSSTYLLNTNISNIGWFSDFYISDFTAHTYNKKRINHYLLMKETERLYELFTPFPANF